MQRVAVVVVQVYVEAPNDAVAVYELIGRLLSTGAVQSTKNLYLPERALMFCGVFGGPSCCTERDAVEFGPLPATFVAYTRKV
jgi:hypothetical protein